MHAQTKNEGAELLGFGYQDDDYERDFRQRGPKGGRGGRDDRRNTGGRGGRRGGKGKAVFDATNDDDFPAL